MSSNLAEAFAFTDAGVCITDGDHEVLFQNEACQEVCGDQVHAHCEKCGKGTVESSRISGPKSLGEKVTIAGKECDVYRFEDGADKTCTVFYVMEKRLEEYRVRFKEAKLTERETEIAELIVKTEGNQAIQDALHITKATLKTHLNHIYQKLPELKQLRQS